MATIMSFLDDEPTAELRLLCLRRFRQGEGYTPWEVVNSPGILISGFQYPRRAPQEVLEMSDSVDEVVNCLTELINNESFQAKIKSRTAADDVRKWTEWQLGAISYNSDGPHVSRTFPAIVKAIIVRQKIDVPEGPREA